jgi:hypothetical protein
MDVREATGKAYIEVEADQVEVLQIAVKKLLGLPKPDVLTTTEVNSLERLAKELDGKPNYVAMATWNVEDVLEKAREDGTPCTEGQAREILSDMDNHQDCDLGISWTTIGCYLDELPTPEPEPATS